MPMSKNTGIPKIRPSRPIAIGAPRSPNTPSSFFVKTSAPPDRSRIAPSTVPRPMMTAMCPRMLPKPVSSTESPLLIAVPTMSLTGSPAASASPRPARSSATNGSSFTLMIVNSRMATASPQSTNSPGVVVRSHSMAEVIGKPFSSGIARRMLREKRSRTSRQKEPPAAEQRQLLPRRQSHRAQGSLPRYRHSPRPRE